MYRIQPVANAQDMASFIFECNQLLNKHIGYAGTDFEEINQTILEDFSDLPINQSAVCAYENQTMIALLAFDVDKEERSVEVWGPFLTDTAMDDVPIKLWTALEELISFDIRTYSFFPSVHNHQAIHFAKKLGAKETGNHHVLRIDRSTYQPIPLHNSIKLCGQEDVEAFSLLHTTHFPNTYMSSEQILNSIDRHHKLFVFKEETVKGYIYVEADPAQGESDIHFFAVDQLARGVGIGFHLLHSAITFLFSFLSIKSISLCVSASSMPAIRLYKRAQFKEIYELTSQVLYSKEDNE